MSLKIKAKERKFKVGKYADTFRYVMVPELYSALTQDKVIREAALRSGVSEGVMHACWDAAGEVIKAWATEGHSVALPGLGTMRFGLSAKSVADVNDVKTGLIKTRRIVFTPAVELKDELKATKVVITCYDRNGVEVKRVTSDDDGNVEEPDTNDNTGENDGGNTNGTDNTNQGGGSSSGSGSNPTLIITKTGSGTSSVRVDGDAVNSGAQVQAGKSIAIHVEPATGQVPTATLNGQSVTLTEEDGAYDGTATMPAADATLVINSGTAGGGVDQN